MVFYFLISLLIQFLLVGKFDSLDYQTWNEFFFSLNFYQNQIKLGFLYCRMIMLSVMGNCYNFTLIYLVVRVIQVMIQIKLHILQE